MIPEFVDIILKIYKALHGNSSSEKVVGLISKEKSYNRTVVAAAYSWIHVKILNDIISAKTLQGNFSGKRFPSDYELQLIGADNLNYLQHFYNVGVITNAGMESVIDKLLIFPEGRISKSTIDGLIFSLFLDLDNYLLPGSRLLLFSQDKIN